MSEKGFIEIRIPEVAKRRGITSGAQLARKIGVSRETGRKLLQAHSGRDITRISIDTLEKLCHGLSTSPAELLQYHPVRQLSPSGAHDDAVSQNPTRLPPS